jgi:CelD/BcsL family acetyltransferase involved in cellulose biosynthesis
MCATRRGSGEPGLEMDSWKHVALSDLADRPGAAVSSSGLTVEIADTLPAMDRLRVEWEALERKAGSGIDWFQTFGWCRNWVAGNTGPDHSTTPNVVCLRDGGRLAAVWPLMIIRRPGGLSVLKTLGEPHTQYSGMLVDPCLWDREHADVIREAVLATRGVDAIIVSLVPECSSLNRVFPKDALRPTLENQSFVIDLGAIGSRESYVARLSKTQKRNRTRRLKLLEKQGAVAFEVVWPGDERFAGLVDQALAFKTRWLKAMNMMAPGFSQLRRSGFLDALPGSGEAPEGACLSVLSIGGKPVAIELGFIRHKHYYAYLGSFDWDQREASPGKVQMDMTIGWLLDNGVETYDLLANQASYKDSWSDRQMRLSCYAVSRNLRGWLYLNLWLAWLKPIAKRLARQAGSVKMPGFRQLAHLPPVI